MADTHIETRYAELTQTLDSQIVAESLVLRSLGHANIAALHVGPVLDTEPLETVHSWKEQWLQQSRHDLGGFVAFVTTKTFPVWNPHAPRSVPQEQLTPLEIAQRGLKSVEQIVTYRIGQLALGRQTDDL